MKTRFLAIVCLATFLAPFAHAQGEITNVVIYQKIAKMDALCNILPLILKKSQIDQLLPSIEKALDNVRHAKINEDNFYKDLEPIVDEANKVGIEKQQMPSDEVRKKFADAMLAFSIERQTVIAQNLDLVQPVFEKVLNAGQLKAAANTVNIQFYDPTAKPEQMSQQDKERMFIRYILLDPVVYDVLIELDKTSTD
jgi:hypothetical protein